jgi:hypothetical protein
MVAHELGGLPGGFHILIGVPFTYAPLCNDS